MHANEKSKDIRILHIDDDEAVKGVLKMALERAGGFEVQSCTGGKTAIRAAKDFHPDIILLDLSMPGMDGPEVLNFLRDDPETAKTPVIFLTGRKNVKMVPEYRQLGVIGVLYKPFSVKELPMILNTILANWEG